MHSSFPSMRYELPRSCWSLAMTVVMLFFTSASAQAQLVGSDTSPGDPCTAKGAVRMTANAVGPGAYVLTCDGDSGQWVATINAELPTANEQVATKEYVDSAMAAGGIGACVDDDTTLCALETSRSSNDPEFTASNIANGVNILGVTGTLSGLSGPVDCPNIGDECTAQGNIIFAGYHPITHEYLFIPPTDQEQPGSPGTFTMNWKNATGTNDISTDSTNDGEINHANRGGAIGDFQAFQACEDLSFGGQTDWYLPSQVELYYLWAVHETIESGGNITNFQNVAYWSSTEYLTNAAWTQFFTNGIQYYGNKNNGYRVRCVRR